MASTGIGDETDDEVEDYWLGAEGNPAQIAKFLRDSDRLKPENAVLSSMLNRAAGANPHPEVVLLLLGAGASVLHRNSRGETSLLHAARCNRTSGNAAIAEALLLAGADPNTRQRNGFSAIYCAAQGGNDRVLRVLVNWPFADVNLPNTISGWSPLHSAAIHKLVSTAKILLENGADVDPRDDRGRTPLHLESSQPFQELLLDYGANIDAQDYNGWTPLHHAASKNSMDIVEWLVSKGASQDLMTSDGKTYLDLVES